MEEFKESTRRAFKQCRTDIESLKIENKLLKEKLDSLGSTNSNLQNTITDLNSEMKGIKIALDYIKSFNENSNSQLNNIQNQQVQQTQPQAQNQISQQQAQPIQNTQPAQAQIQQNFQSIPDAHIPQMPTDPYQALVAFKAKSNKRELLKQKLVSMISENGMNLSELKFMFVDHNRYVSKATFYNYLKELEAQGTISQDFVNGKKHIFANNNQTSNTITDELNSR